VNYKIQKIESHKSKHHDGIFYYVFFKADDGSSYRTCLDPNMRNFRRNGWTEIVKSGVGTIVTNLRKIGNILDADSSPIVVKWGEADGRDKMVAPEPTVRQDKEIPKAGEAVSKDFFR
jgi:hypothetical protein